MDELESFDWDESNEEHLAAHGIGRAEVEQAMRDPDHIGVSAYNVGDERRWALLGATDAGRILFAVYTHREERIRSITARDATDNEKRRYRTQGK